MTAARARRRLNALNRSLGRCRALNATFGSGLAWERVVYRWVLSGRPPQALGRGLWWVDPPPAVRIRGRLRRGLARYVRRDYHYRDRQGRWRLGRAL